MGLGKVSVSYELLNNLLSLPKTATIYAIKQNGPGKCKIYIESPDIADNGEIPPGPIDIEIEATRIECKLRVADV